MNEQAPVEHVLVIPRVVFTALVPFQGFRAVPDDYLNILLDGRALQFMPRPEAEEDPSYKQLIPYCALRHCPPPAGDEERPVRLFSYLRGKGQGEARLHAKRSLGIGGHINPGDGTGDESVFNGPAMYMRAMHRELAEEVGFSDHTNRLVGVLNDDENPVGKVHLGIIHVIDLECMAVEPREASLEDGRWDTITDLKARVDEFEPWSQILLKELF